MRIPAGSNMQVMGLAFSLGWRIAAGFLIGYWLDSKLGTEPWLTLALALAALAAGVGQMIRMLGRGTGGTAGGSSSAAGGSSSAAGGSSSAAGRDDPPDGAPPGATGSGAAGPGAP